MEKTRERFKFFLINAFPCFVLTYSSLFSASYKDEIRFPEEKVLIAQNTSPQSPSSDSTPAAPKEPGSLSDLFTKTASPSQEKPKEKPVVSSQEGTSINFNNVSMVEYVRFMSRLANRNFVFDEEDLQFNITIVSEDSTSVENLMAALMQELRIRDLSMIEQGNNIIIHRNPRVRAPSRVVAGFPRELSGKESEIITRVFRLNTLDPVKASEIIKPLLSDDALVEVLAQTNNLIITDLVTNINKITDLIQRLDSPHTGITIGQYVVKSAFVDSLVALTAQILQSVAQGNPFTLIPHTASNSIYIISNAFIVEKAIAILQNLDLNDAKTKVYSLQNLYPTNVPGVPPQLRDTLSDDDQYGGGLLPDSAQAGFASVPGSFQKTADGKTVFVPSVGPNGEAYYIPGVSKDGKTIFVPEGTEGDQFYGEAGPDGAGGTINFGPRETVELGPDGKPLRRPLPGEPGYRPGGLQDGGFGGLEGPSSGYGSIGERGQEGIYSGNGEFLPGGVGADSRLARDLPVGHIERTIFSIYKLKYRRGDQIEIALRKIAQSLQLTGTANIELLSAINSVQWIESSNAIILTGNRIALEKVRELIAEIDTPLRQVFIEMLILQTSIEDSLDYGVDWATASNGPSLFAKQSFLGDALAAANGFVDFTTNPPTLNNIGANEGYSGFLFGKHITHNGRRFSSIAALIKALHSNAKTKILYNPKLITEDNNLATFFVGTTDRYKTQSITNEQGNTLTNNFQFIDVGTKISITPMISNNGMITLDIAQETSSQSGDANTTTGNSDMTDVNLVPVITKSQTNTRIHVPNGFFVILSGMIQDTENRTQIRIPCLGGIPLIGAVAKQKANEDRKDNLMLFIRPLIVDSEEELEEITKRQQDVFREKCKFRRNWNYEIDETLDLINFKQTDPDEVCQDACLSCIFDPACTCPYFADELPTDRSKDHLSNYLSIIC